MDGFVGKIPFEALRLAIHQTHDCEVGRLVETYRVTSPPSPVDAIDVYLFEIDGHPGATECFAWIVEIDDRHVEVPAVLRRRKDFGPEQALLAIERRRRRR